MARLGVCSYFHDNLEMRLCTELLISVNGNNQKFFVTGIFRSPGIRVDIRDRA